MWALILALLMAPPQRIVSTAPSITEILFALKLGPKVVGVSSFCAYPPEVKSIAKIGTYARPNAEVILAVRPDLIILQRAASPAPPALIESGARVLEVHHTGLASIYESIAKIGEAAGAQAEARRLIANIRARLEEIRRRVAGRPKRSVLFIVGRTPGTLQALVAAGRGSYLNEIIDLTGGRNVLVDSAVSYPRISIETVLALHPEVIVDTVGEAHESSVTELWKQLPIAARIYAASSEIFVVPGPRVVEAALAFERMFFPGRVGLGPGGASAHKPPAAALLSEEPRPNRPRPAVCCARFRNAPPRNVSWTDGRAKARRGLKPILHD